MRNCGLFGKGGSVAYTEDFPELNPLEQEHTMEKSFKQTHNKAKDWEYEEEHRLTNLFFPNHLSFFCESKFIVSNPIPQ